MFYKLLGMLVWNVGKTFLRRRYGSTYLPKPVLAGIAVAAIGGVALAAAAARRSDAD